MTDMCTMTSEFPETLCSLPLRKSADASIRKAIAARDSVALQRAFVKSHGKRRRKLNKALGDQSLAVLSSATDLVKTESDKALQAILQSDSQWIVTASAWR